MGEVWIKEAEDLKPSGTSGTMSKVGPPRAICHVTVSPSGGSWFDAMHKVLIGKKAEPHLLYDPVTDRLGQYFPLDRSARALMNGGKEISHNKVGKVCIQIEFVSNPDGFTRYWKPGPNYRAMMRAIRSWGIEPEFVARPAKSYGDNVRQSWSKYKTTGGWWGHCHVPSPEAHWDPGPIDTAAFFAAAGAATPAPTPAKSEEDELMALTVKNPVTGEAWSAERALWSIWTYAYKASQDAAQALAVSKAQAAKGAPLTAAETEAAVKSVIEKIAAENAVVDNAVEAVK